ncbi:MAG: hypothetical protein RBR87_07740 [Bacteroidales bacterium]|jgi:hypothetical protein|nr:hypothetical protein [Bacteroidales bacterium]
MAALEPVNPSEISKLESLSYKELHARIKLYILDLLQHDFEQLAALMYRHDVSENRFNKALQLPNDKLRADDIATLVIEREKQKIATRLAYAKQKAKKIDKTPEDTP